MIILLLWRKLKKQRHIYFEAIALELAQAGFLTDKKGKVIRIILDPLFLEYVQPKNLLGKHLTEVIALLGEHENAHNIIDFFSPLKKQSVQKMTCHFTMPSRKSSEFELTLLTLPGRFGSNQAMAFLQDKAYQDAALRSFSLFLTNLGHELRTPLNAILGFSELLSQEISSSFRKKECSSYIQRILESGKLLFKTLVQVIDLARLSIHDIHLEEEVVEVDLLIEETLRQMKVLEESETPSPQGLVFSYKPEESVQASVLVDGERISRALSLLIFETMKMVQPLGTVTVGIEKVEGQRVAFRFSYEGKGQFSSEFLSNLQSPPLAYDVHKPKIYYTLGFVVACALADLHGGYIELESHNKPENESDVKISLVLPQQRIV